MTESNIFLTREDDRIQEQGNSVCWVELDNDNIVKQIYDEPGIGRSFVLDPVNIEVNQRIDDFKWLSADIISIIEDKTSEYFRNIRFITKNSTYQVLIRHTSY